MQNNFNSEYANVSTAVYIYRGVLNGTLPTFPSGFWSDVNRKKNAIECTKYLIEEVLKFDDEQIKEYFCFDLLHKYKLRGMLSKVFNNSTFDLIEAVYPGKFYPWDIRISNGFWKDPKNAIDACKWLFEEKLQLNEDTILEQIGSQIFKDHNLFGMLRTCFDGSPYKALNAVYPGKYTYTEFMSAIARNSTKNSYPFDEDMPVEELYEKILNNNQVNYFPPNYWERHDAYENSVKCIRYLFNNHLKLNDEEIKKSASVSLFKEYYLHRMLVIVFNECIFKALDAAFPGRFYAWELSRVPRNFWDIEENRVKAIRWLVEDKLKGDRKAILSQSPTTLFRENGLYGLLVIHYNSNGFNALNDIYPGEYDKSEFSPAPYNRSSSRQKVQSAKPSLNDLVEESKVVALYKSILDGRINKFPPSFWSDIHAFKRATFCMRYLFEDHLKFTDEDIMKNVSIKFIRDNKLGSMLNALFNNSPFAAINYIYPNKFKPWHLFTSNKYWHSEQNRIEACKWLFEEVLEVNDTDIYTKVNTNAFREHGLYGLLNLHYSGSPYNAVNAVYPNKYDKSLFSNRSINL